MARKPEPKPTVEEQLRADVRFLRDLSLRMTFRPGDAQELWNIADRLDPQFAPRTP